MAVEGGEERGLRADAELVFKGEVGKGGEKRWAREEAFEFAKEEEAADVGHIDVFVGVVEGVEMAVHVCIQLCIKGADCFDIGCVTFFCGLFHFGAVVEK